MKRTNLLTLFAALASMSSFAQTDIFMIEYPVSFPMGNLKEYTDKTCWRGFGLAYRHLANDNIAVGVDMSSHLFFEKKDYDTYTFETTSITGVQYRHNYDFCVTGNIDYVLGYGEDVRPFLGIGVGTMYVDRITDFGMYRFSVDTWQFLLEPEVGVSYYVSNGTALMLSANYYAGFDTKDLEGQTYLSLNIGLAWAMN